MLKNKGRVQLANPKSGLCHVQEQSLMRFFYLLCCFDCISILLLSLLQFRSLSGLSGGNTVLTCLQRKPLTSFRSMIPPSHCFYIFHTKQFIVQITFNHFKHPQMKSRNFPTFKMRTEEYLLQWLLLLTMV